MKKLIFTLLLMALASPAFGSNRLDDPQYLKGYYRLNSNVDDYSGHGNTSGTWTGTEAYASTFWGGTGTSTSGNNDHISIGTPTTLALGNVAQSFSVWIKTTDTSSYIYSTRDGSDGALTLWIDASGQAQCFADTSGQGHSSAGGDRA